MKRMILLSLVILLCLPFGVYAASVGGVETQGQGKVGVGLDQEFVFDRDLEFKSIDPGMDLGEAFNLKLEIDQMYRTMLKTSYGILDNLDVYIKLGTADFKSGGNYTWSDPGVLETGTVKIKGDNAFAYGFGMKGKYEFENDWFIGCDVQYLRHKNDYKGMDVDDVGDEWPFHGDVTFQEWHVAPYVAKRIGNFVPYLGVKYSDLRTKFKLIWDDGDEPETLKMKAEDNFGVFVGTDYKIGDVWSLNLEARFVDETAMSLAAIYSF